MLMWREKKVMFFSQPPRTQIIKPHYITCLILLLFISTELPNALTKLLWPSLWAEFYGLHLFHLTWQQSHHRYDVLSVLHRPKQLTSSPRCPPQSSGISCWRRFCYSRPDVCCWAGWLYAVEFGGENFFHELKFPFNWSLIETITRCSPYCYFTYTVVA